VFIVRYSVYIVGVYFVQYYGRVYFLLGYSVLLLGYSVFSIRV